ncbi:N-acetylmuramoyl-L-alanine amidase [Halomicronema hongdechloris C2206]|uniref:N-acetylmuramoyl-L-alanine amidase n=1 Tax=Halomicronema hongdechloris C2206 TaxID=1641165 RepID=A0A1Z3HFZ8_9CYAN|nr:DUF3747 domain-containing protein [Halomicronema hongdechloris]ASC69224.1 N-acetylmuramoyl-L-alanine amidase [Halomicronema hongdechloris C2206]
MAAPATAAARFGQRSLDPERVIAIASPVRQGNFHTLLILHQLSDQRPCWREVDQTPVQVEPLLLQFDFSGICDRSTDSNGYSVRVNGTDLGTRYRLQIVPQREDLVLQAVPIRDPALPTLPIGRTHGQSNGFLKIELAPGWRLTQRTYKGEALGHIYLSHDAPIEGLATASDPGPALATAATPVATNEPPALFANAAQALYRVVVPATNSAALNRVREVEPEAFRTTLDGRSVIQVGLFRERDRAEGIRQQLQRLNLPVQILTASEALSVASTPEVPAIPQGELVVVIDPGHGGRDPGAIGIAGLQEKGINLAISQRVQQQLQRQGITVLMTRSDDRFIDLEPRVTFAERAQADLFVSIHANAISLSRPEVNGLETYYYSLGQRLAQIIHANILRRVDIADRGVRQARFYVLRRTSMPAVLVETGFVTGQDDVRRLRDPAQRNQIAGWHRRRHLWSI